MALAVRAPRPAGTRRANPGLLVAVAASAALQVAGVLVGPLRELLGTDPLGGGVLLACAAVSALPGLALRLARHRPRPDGDGCATVRGGAKDPGPGVRRL
ncbi:cation transporting ATPase C-terminal domain-containing protein [Micromonospora sp. NPDC050686]|uniref:cation transporting ATPase C-terminal domain-containing protein n=1 Tax=Micromonospora sp. NPDC050686 TaxID=3154631 RepID=UPI0034081AF2